MLFLLLMKKKNYVEYFHNIHDNKQLTLVFFDSALQQPLTQHPDDVESKPENDGVGETQLPENEPWRNQDRDPGNTAHGHCNAHKVLLSTKILQKPEEESVQDAKACSCGVIIHYHSKFTLKYH